MLLQMAEGHEQPRQRRGSRMERDTGIEPVFLPWEGNVEPLN